jgi:hypothetical protein
MADMVAATGAGAGAGGTGVGVGAGGTGVGVGLCAAAGAATASAMPTEINVVLTNRAVPSMWARTVPQLAAEL